MNYLPEGHGRRGEPPAPESPALVQPPTWPTHYLLILLRRDGTRRLVKWHEAPERMFDFEVPVETLAASPTSTPEYGVKREYWRQGPFPGEEIVVLYKEKTT